mgnify:CR=1 FL=1
MKKYNVGIIGATGMVGKCLIDLLMLRNQSTDNKIKIIALSRNEKNAKQ